MSDFDFTQVIGNGLGRTGTKSLCKAFELIYGDAVHCPATLKEIQGAPAAAEGCCNRYWHEFPFDKTKFVLTVRSPMDWLVSCKKAIDHYDWRRLEGTEWFEAMKVNRFFRYGYFAKSSTDPNIDELLLAHYFRYNGDVVNKLRYCLDNLLIMDITAGQGWEKLCPFLGVDIPDTPFPNVDDV